MNDELNHFEHVLTSNTFVGIVEENIDPDKKQRVRIRVPYLHGDNTTIPTANLPWAQPKRDNDGLTFSIPEVGKIMNVKYPSGNLYYPIYDGVLHLNINLQKKVEEYSDADYTTFISLCYNHNTQIFIENEKGLNIIHKFNGLNVKKDEVTVLLKDNQTTLYLGDATANQEAMLGTHFMQWFDTLMQTLLNAYIGNNGSACIANPDLINVFTQYQTKRKTFLSKHIYNVDNDQIRKKDFDVTDQIGDKITQSNTSKTLSVVNQNVNFKATDMNQEKGIVEQNEYKAPPTDGKPDTTPVVNTNPVNSEGTTEVDKLVRYLNTQKYIVYNDPYHLNIVAIRNKIKDNGTITNKFDDWAWVFYKDNKNEWNCHKYNITTTPGYLPGATHLPNKAAAMLVYAQFVDKWVIGYHQNRSGKAGGKKNSDGSIAAEHKCLKNATTAQVRNTPASTTYLKPGQKQAEQGAIGINIHHAGNGVTTNVNNWSEGCVVWASKNQHDEFISLCEQQVDKTNKGRFTLTLIPQKDWDAFTG